MSELDFQASVKILSHNLDEPQLTRAQFSGQEVAENLGRSLENPCSDMTRQARMVLNSHAFELL
jgi:hypothetical protein